MEEVLAGKAVMKQSLFEDGLTQREDPIITALQAAEQRWRSVAMIALGLAGGALVAAIVAVTIAVMR